MQGPPADALSQPPSPTPPPRAAAQASSLSSSEPTLRFPRPLGNSHLAKWISASHPDIMRLATAAPASEESGLAESTYELVSGPDAEFKDDYTESMGGSLGSLDFHAPDDVHSLVGTEYSYTHDGDSTLDDDHVEPFLPVSDPGSDEANQDGDAAREADDGTGHVLELDTPESYTSESDTPESDEEARSRSSLEYTQHSLGSPSIATPEASGLVDAVLLGPRPGRSGTKPPESQADAQDRLPPLSELATCIKDSVLETAATALPGLLFAALFALLLPALQTPPVLPPGPETTVMTSTMTATTTSFVTTKPSADARRPHATAVCGMGLMPLDDYSSEEWLFGAKKPIVSFIPHAQSNVLVQLPEDVKNTWLAKDCLVATASRLGEEIEMKIFPVDDGILLKFPKKEAHGVVRLSLKATCRPKMQRMVNVHFGRGIMEGAYEMTKNLAHELSVLVPVAAHEAERRVEGAKRLLNALSDALGDKAVFVSDKLLARLKRTLGAARESLGTASDVAARIKGAAGDATKGLDRASRHAREQLYRVRDVQSRLRLGLLHAQLSARAWWLRATGRREEYNGYKRKAREYMAAAMHAAAFEASCRARRLRDKAEPAPRPWSRILRQGGCHGKRGRGGGRGAHECKAAG